MHFKQDGRVLLVLISLINVAIFFKICILFILKITMLTQFQNLQTRRVLIEKTSNRPSHNFLYCYTMPSASKKVINPYIAQIKQMEKAFKMSEQLKLTPIEFNESLLHHDRKKVIGIVLLHLLKKIELGEVRHVFVSNVKLLCRYPVISDYILCFMEKHGVILYDIKGVVTINYIKFDGLRGYSDYFLFEEIINDVKNPLERFRY